MNQKKFQRSIEVALLWHSLDSDNLGVGALAIGHIYLISSVAKEAGYEVKFTTVGTPNSDGKNARVEVERIVGHKIEHVVYSPRKIISSIKKLKLDKLGLFNKFDVVFDIGEGDSFTDIYGTSRFLRLFFSKLHVLVNKRPLIIAPQTIGPFKKRKSSLMAKFILKNASKVFIRDIKSRDVFQSLLPNSKSIQVIDVAFAMPFTKNIEIASQTVGINVSGLLFNGGYTGGNQFGLKDDYPEFIEELIRYFVEETAYNVELVSHVISDEQALEDDYRACVHLAKMFNDVKVAPKFNNPIEAKSYISGYSLFLGSRMHATIAAFSTSVPVIPLAYSRKFDGLFRTLGYEHSLDLKELTKESLMSEIKDKISKNESLALDLNLAIKTANNYLNEYKRGLLEVLELSYENNK
ncbi:polysaccharide pyruvyl transferase family protein [Pseudoalteromonas sp. MEBiC 03485]|uniref:polysaccharide pyruvyl transferase family protein n=1 Tax=unclassified Pseudoalteromonas TaxID=194690 RepID=UPI00102220FF|nr:polysaccharide pyruvyl transferase family protein [Pseudoalteromonas sp. MEBiC 03485]RZD21691.1 polysaccharide pyruvyl transferase family protein [Pseudoalteromonas sp. MEBiC 03485]